MRKCNKNKVAAHSGMCSQEEEPVSLNVAAPGPNGESSRAEGFSECGKASLGSRPSTESAREEPELPGVVPRK